MSRSRWFPIVALVLIFASLVSTETAEVWCRFAVGAAMDTDDDAGPDFTCRTPSRVAPAPAHSGASSLTAAADHSIVDEPAYCLPHFDLVVLPGPGPRVVVPAQAVASTIESRGPPAQPLRFVRPPPRGPPAA